MPVLWCFPQRVRRFDDPVYSDAWRRSLHEVVLVQNCRRHVVPPPRRAVRATLFGVRFNRHIGGSGAGELSRHVLNERGDAAAGSVLCPRQLC